MKFKISALALITLLLSFIACTSNEQKDVQLDLSDSFTYHQIYPENFPKLNIPGFNFPEDSTVLNNWIKENDSINIYNHAWGIWAGLTSTTKQHVGNQELLVFETWLTPEEMLDSINGEPIKRSNRANLKRPSQFSHFQETVNDSIHESVSYSPAAANFAIENKIFLATTLYDYAKKGMTDIPDFPNDAITIKPVFKILPVSSEPDQGKFAVSTWHGTVDSLIAFSENDWHSCVYVDINNSSNGNGEQLLYPDSNSPPPPTSATTYNLDDFINYKMNEEDAYFFNKEFTENASNPMKAQPGDIVILMAMHVTTKENKRWTWQTYWWAPDSSNPPAPSSKIIAGQRPSQLSKDAAHYAMSVAYYMVNPEEPYDGTDVKGSPNYAFNPYLEAGFGPDVFDDSLSFIKTTSGNKIATYAGVRTNCMSCHVMATINPDGLSSGSNSITPYVGNSYTGLNDPIFKNQLKVDFAWSIESNVDTTGISDYIKNYQSN